jgi:rubrerythrin
MINLRKFKESILSATTEIDTSLNNDEDILRVAISSELSAINLYRTLAEKTNNKELKKVLLDIAKEEKIHVYEFQTLLKSIDKEELSSEKEAQDEIEELI